MKPRSKRIRSLRDRAFVVLCISVTLVAVAVLLSLIAAIIAAGWKHLDADFLTGFPSRKAANAGFKPALWGSIWLCSVCAIVAIPLGVATAIVLEEFAPKGRILRRLHGIIQLNITNLAGVPSIVYGILGLTAFVRMWGVFGSPNTSSYDEMLRVRLATGQVIVGDLIEQGETDLVLSSPMIGNVRILESDIRSRQRIYVRAHVFKLADGSTLRGTITEHGEGRILVELADGSEREIRSDDVAAHRTKNMIQLGSEDSFFFLRLPLGGSVMAGGLTLTLVVLPVIIVSTQEALRAIPGSLREASLAVGATRLQSTMKMILPCAIPGIMTGSILAMSRAIGEAAPLLVIGGFLFIMFTPTNVMDDFAAMPLQIFNWAGRPQDEFREVAASGILVLLGVLLVFNLTASLIRQFFQRPLS